MNGLLIYGPPAVGKSTLELNLRRYYFRTPLTCEDVQYNESLCFLGRTAKNDGTLMATGGAESLLTVPAVPDVDWLIAAVPTAGRDGMWIAMGELQKLDCIVGVLLHTDKRDEFCSKRTKFFSGRDTVQRRGPGRVKKPPIALQASMSFQSDSMLDEAVQSCIDVLGRMTDRQAPPVMTLEEIATEYRGNLWKSSRGEVTPMLASRTQLKL